MKFKFMFFFITFFNLFGFEDILFNFNIRVKYANYFDTKDNIGGLYNKIKLKKYYNSSGFYVEVASLISSPYVYYIFFNKKEGTNYIFPGSYVIRVSRKGVDKIKIFLNRKLDTFIEIKSSDEYSDANFYLLNNLIYKNIKIPLKIKEIALIPFSELISYFSDSVDFKFFKPTYYDVYNNVLNMVNNLRIAIKEAKNIPEVHDGSMDHNGNMVYISSKMPQNQSFGFNCSGFAKWVADSIYQVKTGTLLNIDDLKIRHVSIRGNDFTKKYEFQRDTFFGLDWTRNIAYRINNLNSNLDLLKIKANDVNDVKFLSYIDNRGYKIEDLELLLYYLAVYEPGYMYFASINTGEIKDFPGTIFHRHVVVLFTYFDIEKNFKISLMEVNGETSIKSLKKRYLNSYIHLVRAKVPKYIRLIPLKSGEYN